MKAVCPDCMGALALDASGMARCTIHGGTYRVLFQRSPMPVQAGVAATDPASLAQSSAAGSDGPPLLSMITDRRCVQHPHLAATGQCRSCGAYMCATCDFALPGDIHLCPSCATKPQTEISDKRKNHRAWSYGLATFATLGVVLLFAGAFASEGKAAQDAMGALLSLIILIPSIIGLSLGLGSIDRRLVNPPSLWVATIWNGLIVALFLLLCAVGLMSE